MFLTFFIGWFGTRSHQCILFFGIMVFVHVVFCWYLVWKPDPVSAFAAPDQTRRKDPFCLWLWCNKLWLTIFVERYHNYLVLSIYIWFLLFGFCLRLISDAHRCDMSYFIAVQDSSTRSSKDQTIIIGPPPHFTPTPAIPTPPNKSGWEETHY